LNSGSLGASYSAGQSRVFNLGPVSGLSFHTWSADNGFLRLRAVDLSGASERAETVVDNIVSIKAQYGFDMRTGVAFTPEGGTTISRWSAVMVDADGDGVIGSAGDYKHVVALRIAVVARNKNPEKPVSGNTCTATTLATAPVLFSNPVPNNIAAVSVTPTIAIANDPIDWTCYRYRVFESIVPIRNSGWRPTL
jgi:type IV pilus assembly protein PilW